MLTDERLLEMRDEVRDWTERKGWRGEGAPVRTMGEDLALLHTELAEATEAYRLHGLDRWVQRDGTLSVSDHKIVDGPGDYHDFGPQKPEGVASELADVLIRLLDNYAEHGIEPNAHSIFTPDHGFGEYISALHALVGDIHIKWYFDNMQNMQSKTILADMFDKVLSVLIAVTYDLGFDLEDEYTAKMQYNETREHRHGGKKL